MTRYKHMKWIAITIVAMLLSACGDPNYQDAEQAAVQPHHGPQVRPADAP